MEDTTAEGTAASSTASSNQSDTSLFPLFSVSDASLQQRNDYSQWLQNSSFTTDLSVIEEAVNFQRARDVTSGEFEEEGNELREEANELSDRKLDVAYPLLESSASDGERDSDRKKRRKKEIKKQRRRVNQWVKGYSGDFNNFAVASRRPTVRSWASSESKTAQSSYFDSHGDRDNIEFGCLYRMDIARYKRHYSNKFPGLYYESIYMLPGRNSMFDRDGDCDALDSKIKSSGRYWSAHYTSIQHHKGLKRIHIDASKKCSTTSPGGTFVPLLANLSSDNTEQSLRSVIEESWEDEVLRRTREFNKMTREHPHNEKNWLSFSEFQDKVASMQPQKAARIQTLEKKLSILEKAVEVNPESEELLLALMKSYSSRDSGDDVISRWEKILSHNSWSCKLWKEFLHVSQAEFSRFKVSEMRKNYAHAIQAIVTACKRHHRQVHLAELKPSDPEFIRIELGLVDIFVSLCRLEWQAGHRELATALFQAEIEYCLLCPSLIASEQSKKRLFEHFWNEGSARAGEEGALGWSTWLEREEANRKRIYEKKEHEADGGGWTGWTNPSHANSKISDNTVLTDRSEVEEVEEDSEQEGKKEYDTEMLLHMVGVDFDPEAACDVQDASTWKKWSEEETLRDYDQWMPLHVESASHDQDDRADEHLARVILFEDVSEYLFSLDTMEARFSLVSQFIDFFGGKISYRFCTNSSSWIGKNFCLEEIPRTILDELRSAIKVSVDSSKFPGSKFPLDIVETCERMDMMKFLRNATLLCLFAFPRSYVLQESLLVCEELSLEKTNSSSSSLPSQALAKSLLKKDRQDIVLCGVYARREAAFGNLIQARKIFDMALSSLQSLPLELRSSAPLLYFWFAEAELSNNIATNSDSQLRATHILCSLGNDTLYVPYTAQPSNLLILKARQGFRERIRTECSSWHHGVVEDHSISFICSAALFEELTSGPVAGLNILKQAISLVLPESRKQKYEFEHLFNYYARMLQRYHKLVKQADLRASLMHGLDVYPFSPQLCSILVQISHLYSVPSKLRSILDTHSRKNPSIIAWLFTLTFDLGRSNTEPRIRSLFERSLEDEKLRHVVLLWRCFIAFEIDIACNPAGAKKIFFRAVHACPWSKKLWLDGFHRLSSILTAKELSELQEVMRDKELNLRTDIYEILLQQDEVKT